MLAWTAGMNGGVIGSPTLDGGGVLAAGTFGGTTPGVSLINAANGTVIGQLTTGMTFGQSVFAQDWLFTATSNGVAAWGLPVS